MQLKHRNRSFRRVMVKLADRVTVHYRKRKPKQATCAECKRKLAAVPRLRDYKMSNTAKTMKRPERPYGGVLCTRCMRAKMVAKARTMQ